MAAVTEVRHRWPKIGDRQLTRTGRAGGDAAPTARAARACGMDHGHFHQIQDDLRVPYRALREAIPEVMAGYATLSDAAMAEGALSAKVKELIALSISITRECDGCIVAHARGCVRRGVSVQELTEMIGVTINLNGGPATVWGPRALAAYQEYSGAEPLQEGGA